MDAEVARLPVGTVDLDRVVVRGADAGDVEEQVAEANSNAVQRACQRLGERVPAATLEPLKAYFTSAGFERWPSDRTPPTTNTFRLLQELCSRVHSIAINQKAKGLQIGFLGLGADIDPSYLGVRIEPDSDLYFLSPNAVWAAAQGNASVEIRIFDRQLASWARLADDVAAVSGADVFMKLFVAGGHVSVNDWHRDSSDVLVTVLDGSKRFEVGTVDSRDEAPISEIDAVLRPGDALLLPRSRLHKATPTGEVSTLLSIGIMRYGDWSYRGATPSHLGLRNPRSPLQYRFALQTHIPPSWVPLLECSVFRTRIPGGIGVIDRGSGKVRFVAAGQVFEAGEGAVRVLAMIHGEDGMTPALLAERSGQPQPWCMAVTNLLMTLGLVWQSAEGS